ncbi:MAG TPA: uroporphyrinogen decarboxylase family protein [Gemmataceae bacterium]|jgi:uroporphyrinogen decarboxylase|nr:uroporphyrinogen decarboxylase family protein [Gemmataceae bacterium]
MADVSEHLLVRAARGERVERPPVWAMRQAGRWDPEFQKVRAGLGFYEFSENVERAAQATLCPRRFGVDGIILFYDITTLPVAMGLPFELKPQQGPVPNRPIRMVADVDRLDPNPDPDRYGYIIELLRTVKRELNGELPILAFAGAPFTVAAYCIGTGKRMEQTRQFAAEQPAVWQRLLDKLSGATIGFLNALIREGAAAYQLFDSWAGDLTPAEYDQWAQPYHREILAGATGVPRILFVKESPYLERMVTTGAEVVSLGARHDLAAARRQYPHLVFQGNVDSDILKEGTTTQVQDAVRACLAAGGGQRHIVNLNHGVDKATPVGNFETFIRTAQGR